MEGEASCSRTEEDVVATLTLSKLEPGDLSMPSQTLFFSDAASDQDHFLIQLNNDILKSVEEGEEIVIRGNTDDSATLCTSDKTYDIKKAKISNSLLLLPDCCVMTKKDLKSSRNDDEKENIDTTTAPFQLIYKKIEGWTHEYFELKQVHPKVNMLRALLNENPYQGPQKEEENSHKNKYTMSQFLNRVQASEGELVTALFKLGACCMDGFWRVLDFGYVVDCLGDICNVINCESWSVFRVPLEELCEKINDSGELVPEFIVRHLLSFYGHKFSEDNNEVFVKLNEEKLCRFFAEMLLRDVGKFNLQEFLTVWQQSVPDEITTDEKYLLGLALIDRSAKPPTIQHFPVDSMSQNPSERFDALFEIRPKWTRDDIEPYIMDLCLEGQSVSALITKYSRSSITNGTKLFSSRKSLRLLGLSINMSMNQYMHSRNIYKDKPPDFLQLSQLYPSFAPYVKYSKAGKASVDFRNPDTVRELANCLLNKDFGYTVHLPKNRLSPTIPSRLNYILWVEDLLDTLTTKQSEERKIIDIGTGCACIYPLLGVNINRRFVFTATEMDDTNFKSAKNNVERNHLMDRIKVLKIDPTVKTLLSHVFEGDTERYDCCICNPPFYKNVEDVISRGRAAANSSCRASNVEAITEGGDLEFAERIYRESLIIRDRLSWYTIMFGKKSSFMSFKKKFVGNESILTATYEFCQGNTIRWGFAWSYTPQSINASKIPTSPFQQYSKASRQSKPISFYIEAPTVESSKELLLKIFKDLAISVEIPSTDPAGSSFSAVAIQNTWVGARQRMRKRKYNDICNDMVVLEAKSLPEPVLEFQVTMNEQASGCTLTTFKTEIQSKKEVLNSLVVHIKRLLSKHLQAK